MSSNIPFIDMAEYFRGLKTAEDAKAPAPTAAPPPEQVLPMYAQLANLKTSLAMAYRVYSESLRGEANTALGEHFKEHSEHHLEDADWFIRRCSVLGGPTDFGEIQLPPPATDTQTIVRTLASLEEQSIAALNELRPLVEGSPSQYELEGMLSRDQHHLDDMWQHIPDTPATSAVQPAGPPPPPAPAESVPKQANTVGAVAATGKHAPVQAPPALQGAAAGQHPVKMAWIKTAARTYDLGEGTARDGNAFAVKSEPSQLELAMALQGKMDGDFHAAKGHGKHLTMFSPAALGGGGAIELGAHNHGTLIPAGGATRGHLLKQYGKGPSISPAMMDSIERNDGDVREQFAMNGVKVGRNLRLEAALGHIKKAAFRTDEENVETGRQRAIANLSSGFTSDRYTSGERHGQLLGKLTGAGAGALAGAMAARKESIPVRLAAGLGAGALGGSLGGALGKVVGQDRDATNFYREHSKEAACLGDVAEEMRPEGRTLADAQKLTQGLGASFELGGRNPKDAKSSWTHPKRHPSVKEASDPFARMMLGWAKTANALVHEPDPAVAEYIAREEQARMQQEAQESEYLRSQLQAAHAELESKDQEVQQLQQSVGQLQEQTQMQQDTIATAQATTEGAMGSVVQKSNELMKQMQLTSNLSQAHQMMKEQLQSLAQMPSPPLTGGESAATDQAASDELAMQDQAAAEQEAAAAGQQPGVPAEGGSPPPGGQGEAGPPKVAGLPHGLLGGGIGALAGAGSVLLASKERAKIDELIGKMEQSDSKGFSHAMALAHLKHQSNLAQIAADHPGRSALVAGVLGGQAGMGVESNIRHLLKGEPYHPLHNAELK